MKKQMEDDYSLYVQNVEEIEEEDIDWLIPKWIPKGGITLLVGDGGIGKTNLWSCLISDISSGMPTLLDNPDEGREYAPGHIATLYISGKEHVLMETVNTGCLYFSKEDSTSKRLKRNFELYEANMYHIHTIDIEHLTGFNYASESLEKMIDNLRPAIVVFDPIQAFFPSGASMTSRQQSRKALDRLVQLGQAYNTAFLLVCHTNKKPTDDWRQRISGSADLPDIARSVIFTSYTEVKPRHAVRFISNEKNSYAELQETILYEIDRDGRIRPVGASDKRFADYMREGPYTEKTVKPKTEKELCKETILQHLDDRKEIRICDLDKLLRAEKFGRKAMSAAKTELEKEGRIERFHTKGGAGGELTMRLKNAEGKAEGDNSKKDEG